MSDAPRHPRLGMFTGRQVVRDGDRLVAEVGLGRVVNELHRHHPELVLASVQIPEATERHNEPLDLPPEQWIPMPPMPNFATGLRHTLPSRRALRQIEDRCEVLLVQLAFQAPLALLGPRTPRVYHVFGDVLEMARHSSKYEGLVRPAAVGYARLVDLIQRRLAARPDARLVTNGEALLRHLGGRGTAVVSSTLTRGDLASVTRQRPTGGRPRVLFVAHLRPEKGLDLLLEAMRLVRADVDAELEVVGFGTPAGLGRSFEAAFGRAVAEGWATHVGPRPFGPELFQHFADADLFVLPSRSEGTPRALVEARAFGCPVIATTVGGIPSSVIDGVDGLLVPPERPDALADAIRALLTDPDRAAQLARAGRERAEGMTVESFAAVLLHEVDVVTGAATDGTPRHRSAVPDVEAPPVRGGR